jgi:hypothetical protein
VPWLRRLVAGLSPRSPVFAPWSIHVGFVVDKVALGHVFLRDPRISPLNFIPPSFSIVIYRLGDETYVRLWQQFRDIVSPHKKVYKIYNLSKWKKHRKMKQETTSSENSEKRAYA